MSTELMTQNENTSEDLPGFFSAAGFELMQRVCKTFMTATIVPKEYQGNLGNCIIAFNMAMRMKMDPITVMQNLNIINGKPGWSSKFLIALFNQSKEFSKLKIEYIGIEGTDSYGCTVGASVKSTGEELEPVTVTVELAKRFKWYERNGSQWPINTKNMLFWRSAAWFINSRAPELGLGLQTMEEIIDTEGSYDAKTGEYVKPTYRPLTQVNNIVDITEYEEKVNNSQDIEEIKKICSEGSKKLNDAKIDPTVFRKFCINRIDEIKEICDPTQPREVFEKTFQQVEDKSPIIDKNKTPDISQTLEKIEKMRKESAEKNARFQEDDGA